MIVECINDKNLPDFLLYPIKKGKLYTVITTVNSTKGTGYILDECYELTPSGNPVSYLVGGFANMEIPESISELLTECITI